MIAKVNPESNAEAFAVSAPIAVRVLGDFSAYLQRGDALATATQFRVSVRGTPRSPRARLMEITAPELNMSLRIHPQHPSGDDIFSAVVKTFLARGLSPRQPFSFQIEVASDAQLLRFAGSGLTAAWTFAVARVCEAVRDLSGQELAEIASESLQRTSFSSEEALVVPASVLGDLVLYEQEKETSHVFSHALNGLILCPPRDAERAAQRWQKARDLVRQALDTVQDANGKSASLNDLGELIADLQGATEETVRVLYALEELHAAMNAAREILEAPYLDCAAFGEVLDRSQEVFAAYMELADDEDQSVFEAARGAGAFGAKIDLPSGAYLVYAPDKTKAVLERLREHGLDPIELSPGGGVFLDEGTI